MSYESLSDEALEAAFLITSAALVERTLELIERTHGHALEVLGAELEETWNASGAPMERAAYAATVAGARRAMTAAISSPTFRAAVAASPPLFRGATARRQSPRGACGASQPQR